MKLKQIFLAIIPIVLVACQTAQLPVPNDATQNQSPEANFIASVTQGQAPLVVSFDASSSTDSDGFISNFAWDFGDGSSGTGVSTTHTYTQAGTYTVTLTATDNQGDSAQQTGTITVNDTTPSPNEPSSDAQAIQSAWNASQSSLNAPDELTSLAVEVAIFASQQANGGNQLVTTGTVRETSQGVFSYEATPNDSLNFIRLNGAQITFKISRLEGDFSSDGSRFINNDHAAIMQINSNAQAGSINAELQSGRLPRQQGRTRDTFQSIEGSFVDDDGLLWQADIQTQGTHFFDVDSTQLETFDQTTGTLRADSLGLIMNLNSEEIYKTINLVENLRQRIAHSWQLNGSNYQLNNTEIFIALKENAPVDQDQWVIAGTLLKDGTPVGQVAEDNADPSKLQVSLFMGNDKIILISINRF